MRVIIAFVAADLSAQDSCLYPHQDNVDLALQYVNGTQNNGFQIIFIPVSQQVPAFPVRSRQ